MRSADVAPLRSCGVMAVAEDAVTLPLPCPSAFYPALLNAAHEYEYEYDVWAAWLCRCCDAQHTWTGWCTRPCWHGPRKRLCTPPSCALRPITRLIH
jgi:hypothetical protein